jgi:methionine-gamma-lyase
MDTNHSGRRTREVHAGDYKDAFGSVVTPIYQTSTFEFSDADHGARLFAGEEEGYIYTRLGNPTVRSLEEKLAALENGRFAVAFASGMGAVSTLFAAMSGQGDHILSTDAVYGPSRGILETYFRKFGVDSTFIDTSDPFSVEKAIRPNTRLIYIETPTNPTIKLTDIEQVSAIAHQYGIPVSVDNTFSSPVLQNPLDLGADIVLHSLTKFINGHADVVGGALITNDVEIHKILRKTMSYFGPNMDPHQAYLIYRGAKTLSLRVWKAQENALQVAGFLEKHPKVAWVRYPGLKSHEQYDLAQKQMRGPGSMMSFGIQGGLKAGKTLMNSVRLSKLAVSLCGVETLIQHPASMTHAGLSPEARKQAGITDDLVRFSVGIEDVEDIIADLEQALDRI